jgi:acetyl-CoA carboxylase alpha subunit
LGNKQSKKEIYCGSCNEYCNVGASIDWKGSNSTNLQFKQLKILQEDLNIVVVDSIVKKLMCNDVGKGAMATLDVIIETVEEEIKKIQEIENDQ